MLEREIDIILQTVVERTIGPRLSCGLERVTAANIPAPLKVYLIAEVEHWLEGDLRASARFSRLDDQAVPYLNHVTRTFLRTTANAYRFTREEFLATLDQAVHFVENYLCRPQWTLENFLFHQQEVILFHQFQTKLLYFSEYRYFITLLERTAIQRAWAELHRDDVRTLIRKIDDEVVSQHSPRELAYLTKPIFRYLLLDEDPFSQPVSLRPLLVFFEDKGLLALRDHIKKTCLARGQAEITLNELAAIIESSVLERNGNARGEGRQATEEPVRRGDYAARTAGPTPEDEERSIGAELAELQAQGEENTELPPLGSVVNQEITGLREDPLAASPDADGQETPSEHPSPPAAPPSLADLQSVVTYEQSRRFIKKLFGDDEGYYMVVLTTLNSMATWKDASSYLNDFFELNRLDPCTNEVIEFTDVIHQRYSTERAAPS